MRPIYRPDPHGPSGAYKTYSISLPARTHWRPATCEEAECEHYLSGWRTVLGVDQTDLVEAVRRSGRSYTEVRDQATVTFAFVAGQPCFRASQHRVRTGLPEVYAVRDGDWRGNPLGTRPRVHARPDLWVEDFAEHQQALAARIERG